MPWNERIRAAAYTSPLGFRIELDYEDVSREIDKKTTEFNFPTGNKTYIQDLGRTGNRYPMRLFFWGDDYDRDALRFETELNEPGIGRLDHPIYGTVNVVPFGMIRRRDDLKTAANQAVIEVTFYETIFEIYAGAITDLADGVFSAISLYNAAASGQLNAEVIVDKVFEDSSFKNFYGGVTGAAVSGLGGIAGSNSDVSSSFNATVTSMQTDLSSPNPIDVETLSLQTTNMAQVVAKADEVSISDRLSAYEDLANPLMLEHTVSTSSFDNVNDNEFHARDMFVSAYLTGMIVSAINTEFVFKKDAIDTTDRIITVFENWVLWRDINYAKLEKEDTGDLYQYLHQAVADITAYIVQISFTLQTEKFITLTYAKSIIDAVAELYGNVDDKLDFFITSNNLTGSEILELPKGREIVYYV
jgi:hypothetical protein